MEFHELFTICGRAAFRKWQEEGRPFHEKLGNAIREFSRIRAFREKRGVEIAIDVVPLFEHIMKRMQIEAMLDEGCGQMEIADQLTKRLKERNPNIKTIGIDNSAYVADYKINEHMVFCLGDALDTGLSDGSVQVAIVFFLHQALNKRNQERLFKELKRVIVPGGYAIFTEVIKMRGVEGVINTVKHYALNPFKPYDTRTVSDWEAFWEDHGYTIVDSVVTQERCRAWLCQLLPEKQK